MKNSLSFSSFTKSPYHITKHTTYFEVYDELFSDYRDKEIIFVEIGVLNGGSLFMWRDFFGPKARIIGIDLNPNAKKWEKFGFEIFIGSQTNESFWNKFKKEVGLIDIVLDDGGHTYEQQIITTETLLDNIKDGGLIVIEDTHTSYMEKFGPKKYSFIEYTKNMIDLINQRFSRFKNNETEDRVWGIRIFESIVAFNINKKASSLSSDSINNNGKNDMEEDFRYKDNTALSVFYKSRGILRILRKIPGIKTMLARYKFQAKKFFR